jgi:ankyrin repeat protein
MKHKALTPADLDLIKAAKRGDLGQVKTAIAGGARLDAREEYGGSALHAAADEGHLEVAEHLISQGADLNLLDAMDMSPMMKAAVSGRVNVVKFLAERDAIVSRDLLMTVNMKVNILEENAEAGMVKPEAVEAWKGFLDYLVRIYEEQNEK